MPDRPAAARPDRERRERYLPGGALIRDRLDTVVLVAIGALAVLLAVLGSALSAGAAGRPPAAAPGRLILLPMPTPPLSRPVVWIVGDEFAAGTGSGSWTVRTAKALGFEQHVVTASGLGYTHAGAVAGTATTVRTAVIRAPDSANVLVLAAGRADHAASALLLAQAVVSAIHAAQRQAPTAKIILIGPAAAATDAELDTERNALRSAATQTKADFVDPIGGRWLTAADLKADGSHLTAAGQQVVAARLEPVLKAALAG